MNSFLTMCVVCAAWQRSYESHSSSILLMLPLRDMLQQTVKRILLNMSGSGYILYIGFRKLRAGVNRQGEIQGPRTTYLEGWSGTWVVCLPGLAGCTGLDVTKRIAVSFRTIFCLRVEWGTDLFAHLSKTVDYISLLCNSIKLHGVAPGMNVARCASVSSE